MKKLLLSAAAIALSGAPAFAADLDGRPGPFHAPRTAYNLFDWTGFYAGSHAGWGWAGATGADPSGYLIGLQAGYNFQYAGGLLTGIESDIAFSGIHASASGAKFDLDYLGTVRGRLGYASDRYLVYGAGGLAYGRGDMRFGGLSSKRTHVGWTIGAGVEALVAPNITARLEYLYVDLGSKGYATAVGPARIGIDANIVRVAMNYKF